MGRISLFNHRSHQPEDQVSVYLQAFLTLSYTSGKIFKTIPGAATDPLLTSTSTSFHPQPASSENTSAVHASKTGIAKPIHSLKVQRRSRKQRTKHFNNKDKTSNQHLDLPIIATNADAYVTVTVYTHNQMQPGQQSPLESSYPVTAGSEYFNHAKEQEKTLIPTIWLW